MIFGLISFWGVDMKTAKDSKKSAKPAKPTGSKSGITKDEVLKVLRNVIDPEIGMNIVDLGFIYGVDIKGANVKVRMTLTNPGCPMHSMFTHEVVQALGMAFEGVEATVELVFDPPWTPERMSKDARKKLGIK
jgi:metal-sulfur cluster biosynthetic enzyme